MKDYIIYRIRRVLNVKTAVWLTLAIGDLLRFLRSSIITRIAAMLFILVKYWAYIDFGDTNIWFMFYLADITIVVTAAAAGMYLGFSGFFVITFISSLCFAAVWAYKFSYFMAQRQVSLIELGPLSKYPGIDSGIVIYVDHISYSFALLTSLISLCVYLYAFSYMRFEKNILNFLVYFKLFGWSMILLVMAGSWFTLLLGWELIGITSFLLINFWTSKIGTLKSAFKAFVFNKISDAALIGGICLCLMSGISYINSSAAFTSQMASNHIFIGSINVNHATLFLLCIIIAACCKSAQFGFHFWLPDSMEAPVPASALIHSATLVSAGIYLLLRFNNFFLACPNLSLGFAILTAFTSFYGAIIASFQTDVKKILAYSTISHCGMLMFSILMHQPYITIFYLFAHGFFKSINFMCVGNFIQAANNYQDTSRMGRFFALFKFEFYFFAITLFNLSSGPLFFCFFSKHWLISNAYANGILGSLAVCFIYAAAFCGAFYSSKLMFECMLAFKRAHHSVYSTLVISGEDKFFRKSNLLGRAAMASLFIIAFIVLFYLWQEKSSSDSNLADDYAAILPVNYSASFYAVHVWFSASLAITAGCYVSFKRGVQAWLYIMPLILIPALAFILM